MGGSAFASRNLITPRIPPDLYEQVKDQLVLILRQHFIHVDSAIEAPGKKDHGDIDILVAEPLDAEGPPKSDKLASWIGAPHWRSTPGSDTFNFAVPWPGFTEEMDGEEKEDAPSCSPRFIQVDIHICPSAQSFSWHLFFQAHGDLWNMIGSIIRRFGLTCNDHGFFLRVAEVEPYNKDLSRVLLTKDPDRVLQYLGLDERRYWTRFGSWDEMMNFAASCRFHNPNHANSSSISLQARLKASDRQRLRKRPAFSHWIDTYLPMHNEDPVGHSAHLTRVEVVVDAKAWFGEAFTLEFEDRKARGMREIRVKKLWTDIRRSLPIQGRAVGLVMQGLKMEIEGEAGEEDHIGDSDVGLIEARRGYKEGSFEIVAEWATKNWKSVEERQILLELNQISRDFKHMSSPPSRGDLEKCPE